MHWIYHCPNNSFAFFIIPYSACFVKSLNPDFIKGVNNHAIPFNSISAL